MFGNIDLNEMMQKLQEQLKEADNKTYTAKSGGGLVEASVNGKLEVVDLKIDDSFDYLCRSCSSSFFICRNDVRY